MSDYHPNWHAVKIGPDTWAMPINPDCGPTKTEERRIAKQMSIEFRKLRVHLTRFAFDEEYRKECESGKEPCDFRDLPCFGETASERVECNHDRAARWRAHVEKERLRRRLEKARKRMAPHTPIDSDGIRKVLSEFWSTPLISGLESRGLVAADPAPRYDEVFEVGRRALDEEARGETENQQLVAYASMVPIDVPSCVYKSCGKPAHRKKDRSFSVYCADHLKKNVDRSNKRSRDLKDAGRCCQCGTGEIANIGGWRCRECLDFNNEKRRSGT